MAASLIMKTNAYWAVANIMSASWVPSWGTGGGRARHRGLGPRELYHLPFGAVP
jgi:hypothetical protein